MTMKTSATLALAITPRDITSAAPDRQPYEAPAIIEEGPIEDAPPPNDEDGE